MSVDRFPAVDFHLMEHAEKVRLSSQCHIVHCYRRGRRMFKGVAWLLAAGFSLAGAEPAAAVANPGDWPLDGQHLRAEQAWSYSRGRGVTVAVVDTGCEGDQPDLSGQVLPGAGFVGISGDDGRVDVSPDSHGTSIAALIAGTGNSTAGRGIEGLAPQSKILPVRVSAGDRTEPVALARGIIYAVDHGARVIDVSRGTTAADPNLRAAVDHALSRGTIVVAAVGNNGQTGNAPNYPASFPGVVAVSGVDSGNRFWPGSTSGPMTTLAAPAVDIRSASSHGGYLRGDGTSYAAPYVSATAALVWSKYPQLSAGQVVRQIIDTADRHGDGRRDDQFGFGIVDPLQALSAPAATESGVPAIATPPTRVGWWWYLVGGVTAGLLGSLGVFVCRRQRI
ncbi:S8 family serine peptidase [Amycolatopsis sp. NPDC004079]|uniref:S8 family serine peptidase n=1 Tax=Amycolatopsis sp. NPDC004079 TaxID=3154549 RepID=UPI0033A6B888